jgi:hypothetical protein
MVVREVPEQPYGVGASDRAEETTAESPAPGAPESVAPPAAAEPDIDGIEALGEEYVALDAHIDAATRRALGLLAEFDRLRGWELAGYPSCAHWIAARRKVDLHTARERVRTARALAGLPLTSAAMGRGELSFSQVRELTRAATPDNEEDLLRLSRDASVKDLERMIRAWKKGSRQSEEERERARYESRTLAIFPDDDGGYVLKARLTAEQGAQLMRAVEAAGDALFREQGSAAQTDAEKHREAGQRRADAIVLLAERAMAAGFGPPSDEADVPISGSRAERYQVVLHVTQETLVEEGEPGLSELDDGTRVPRGTSRRLSCDASVIRVAQSPDGTVLDVGRTTRAIPQRLRRALEIRDRGCRFPGCGRRFTDGHHVRHWADGGGTSLDNCLLLCHYHHGLEHEGGWTVGWDDRRRPIFFDPRGHVHYEGRWQAPKILEEGVAALLAGNATNEVAENAGRGEARNARTASPLAVEPTEALRQD